MNESKDFQLKLSRDMNFKDKVSPAHDWCETLLQIHV